MVETEPDPTRTGSPVIYHITIGPPPVAWRRIVGLALAMTFLLSGPVVNHTLLTGAWHVDLIYQVLALVVIVLVVRDLMAHKHRRFDSEAEAINWLHKKARERDAEKGTT